MNADPSPCLFAPAASRAWAQDVAAALGVALQPLEEREFEDGEHKSRPLVEVRGRDTYLLYSLHGDAEHSAGDKLCRLLFLIGGLRDAAAARVTADPDRLWRLLYNALAVGEASRMLAVEGPEELVMPLFRARSVMV